MPAPAGTKTCLICGEDCSNRPRVKDPQGRYTCKACLEKAKAAKEGAPPRKTSAPAPAAMTDDAGVLSKLIDDSLKQQGPPCTSCGSPMSADQVICVRCGFNKASGKAARTQVLAAPKERIARAGPKVRLNIHFSPGALFFILVALFGAGTIGALAMESKEAAMGLLVAFGIYSTVMQIVTIVGAFKDGDSGWGIIGIISFLFGCLYLAVIYYILAVSDRAYTRAMFFAWLVTLLLTLVVMVNAGISPEDLRRR